MGNLIDLLFSYLFENKSSKKTGTTYIHKERGLETTSMAWPLEMVFSVSPM
jgi:hypothetical protein